MTNSMWLVVASMLATVAGVVVNKIVESITGQQAKNALDKERAKITAEYTQMRKQLQERIGDLEKSIEKLHNDNMAIMRDNIRLELEYRFCKQQFAWIRKCNPKMFESCPNMDVMDVMDAMESAEAANNE